MARSGSRRFAGYCRLHLGRHPDATQRLKDEIEAKAAKLPEHPKLYRPGRVIGTREMVVRPNYLVIYTESTQIVTILRVLHAAQQWPPTQE